MIIKAHVKRNTYFDSISLMKIARTLTAMDGIEDAAAIMGTEPNLQLLAEAGLTPFEGNAGPADVLLVVRANNDSSAEAALQAAEKQLAQRPTTYSDSSPGVQKQPRSLEQALQLQPDARLAVISVPGPYAALESERALRAGLHVFLFSDNVSLADEIALKQLARERDLLLLWDGQTQWSWSRICQCCSLRSDRHRRGIRHGYSGGDVIDCPAGQWRITGHRLRRA
ncbi:MAG: hypothetical protein E6J33_01915 [Chloroflexi bacterium]|nr:MAG: hypothetical protein E6J33_01915 [Chloroflexota bacterium]